MIASIESVAKILKSEEIYRQVANAFNNRRVTAYNHEGIAYRDIVKVQAFRRGVERLKDEGGLDKETARFPFRTPAPHEVFFNNERDFKTGLDLSGMIFAYHVDAVAREHIDSFPLLAIAALRIHMAATLKHEQDHMLQLRAFNVEGTYAVMFDQDMLTGEPRLAAAVVPFGEIPIVELSKIYQAPHEPSVTDRYVAQNLSF